jgi:hypothetical protein
VINTTNKEIDYDKLIDKFGSQKITAELLQRYFPNPDSRPSPARNLTII